MAYVALYRKYRPQSFTELVGQDHITRTLLNQLESGRIAHAYLFAGPRGTGKTSTAKLFARAINCAHPVNGNPCGECDACASYSNDENMDIIEIDAASNNGVDNIRDIREKVVFAPAYGKYKVYIIDEVHMLSGGAFNALLKTLEEPPKHIVFILATTEIHKLPATILSRCQRFDFKLISSEVIFDRLSDVLKQSGATFEKEAIELIAKSANGGMRDALSLADVCLSYCGNNVTLNDAMNILGISDRSFVFGFSDALIKGDAELALEKCRQLESEGKDIGVFAIELMEHLRDIMLCLYAPQSEELKNLTDEMRTKLIDQSKHANGANILRSIDILSQLESEIKLHSRPDIQFESAVVRICLPETESGILSLEDRIDKIEKMLKNGIVTSSAVMPEKNENNTVTTVQNDNIKSEAVEKKDIDQAKTTAQKQNAAPQKKASPQAPVTSNSAGIWKVFSEKLKQTDLPLYMMIRNFNGEKSGDKFIIYVPETAKNKEALINKNADKLSDILEPILNKRLKLEVSIGGKPSAGSNNEMMQAALDLFS